MFKSHVKVFLAEIKRVGNRDRKHRTESMDVLCFKVDSGGGEGNKYVIFLRPFLRKPLERANLIQRNTSLNVVGRIFQLSDFHIKSATCFCYELTVSDTKEQSEVSSGIRYGRTPIQN